MIRIGFILEGNGWLGGINYYRNLFSALELLSDKKIQPVMFVGRNVSEDIVSTFRYAQIVRTSLLDSASLCGRLRRLANKISGRRDPLIGKLLQLHNIELLSHSGGLLNCYGIKTLGWIPDFQHIHLPEFHSARECHQRDIYFKALIKNCTGVVVSSAAALGDLKNFAPQSEVKGRVLRFVPEISMSTDILSIDELNAKYGLQMPYFYVPNQFWAHKNHRVVIAAMARLKVHGICPDIVFSGNTQDYRNPRHFEQLIAEAKHLGVDHRMKILGVIPYVDLVSLMHYSVAIINPSLFEGWSSTVEEAKAVDKKILLSDIAVHREQAPPKGVYFDPHNAENLFEIMRTALTEWKNDSSVSNKFEPSEQYWENRKRFAQNYQHMVLELLGK